MYIYVPSLFLATRKLNKIKKYLNKHFGKKIIILNYILFILFIEKLNEKLLFYINY